MESVLLGNDTLALLPTGGGKSICFQVPALVQEGLCLVVSPLVALMKDQVSQLRKRNIPAACIVAGMHHQEIEMVLNQCVYGGIKLLYVSPERLKSGVFMAHFKQMRLSLIAVDEAHCISQWGYDFRPPYLDLGLLRDIHPQVPILALTATATPAVAEDIMKQLRFRTKRVFRKPFFRENLAYMVIREDDKQGRLLRIVRKVGGSGIVYVRNRRRTQEVARFLLANGVSAEAYHAGFAQKERDIKYRQWMKMNNMVMVATNAFGMGIDKPDVRFVVHLDIPDSLEAYFQEAGRAGRDGAKAYAVLLYEDADVERLDHALDQQYPPLQQIRNVYRAICNYYQIPVGSGAEQQFDFDLDSLCHTYGFDPVSLYCAARFLEREGLVALPEQGDAVSKLFFPIGREDLYRFEVENKRYGNMLQVMLRMYGGLFSDFTPIMEREVAKRCNTTEVEVEYALQQLDKLGIAYYKKKSSKAQIVFLLPRVEADSIYISDANYRCLKEAAVRRKDEMMRYVKESDICRSVRLSAYFGDIQTPECRICDVCLRNNSTAEQRQERQSLLDSRIRSTLSLRPMTIKDLASELNDVAGEELSDRVRLFIDQEDISVDPNFLLRWEQ